MNYNNGGSTSLSGLNGMNSRRRRNSFDDEENEEIMRANGQYARNTAVPSSTKSNDNINTSSSSNHDQGNAGGVSKSAAENWKGIGNRHMASQVSADSTILKK